MKLALSNFCNLRKSHQSPHQQNLIKALKLTMFKWVVNSCGQNSLSGNKQNLQSVPFTLRTLHFLQGNFVTEFFPF